MRVLVCLCSRVCVCAFALVRLCCVCMCACEFHVNGWHRHWHVTCVDEHIAFGKVGAKASRGFEPRLLDSESRVLTVTPRGLCDALAQRDIGLATI